MDTFLVHLSIVLSLRKAPIGLVYKPTYVSLPSLASSMLYLHSNLVSSLGLPVWLKPHKLLITRLPSKKTSLDLSLDLGLTNLLSSHHHPKDTDRNSTCPHTTPECALLEIWLCRLCNKRTSSSNIPLLSVEGHSLWNNILVQWKHRLWFRRKQFSNWGSYSTQNTLYSECSHMQNCSPAFVTLICNLYTQTSFFSQNQLGTLLTWDRQSIKRERRQENI